jgi:hypothetical protein
MLSTNFNTNPTLHPKPVPKSVTNPVPKTRSKSPLNDFFEQEEIKKSKAVTFSQLLSQ